MTDSSKPSIQRGFTLLELIVTVAVAAVLLALAVPSFQNMIASNALSTASNDFVSALNLARMQAIKGSGEVLFCGQANAGTTDLSADCNADDPGAVYVLEGVNATQIKAAPALSSDSLHLKTANAVKFGAQAFGHLINQEAPYSGTVAVVCSESISSDNIRTITMTTGSTLEVTPSSGGCP